MPSVKQKKSGRTERPGLPERPKEPARGVGVVVGAAVGGREPDGAISRDGDVVHVIAVGRVCLVEVVTGVVADDAFDARLHLLGHEAVQFCVVRVVSSVASTATADPASTAIRTGAPNMMCFRIEPSYFSLRCPWQDSEPAAT